ncbi:MAG: hypothetical protein ACF8SC_13095 [Phycisphaerales bacterium JB037]
MSDAPNQSDRLARLESRLAELARANRRWRRLSGVTIAVGVLATAAGLGRSLLAQPTTADTLAANRVLVLNQDGLPVVTLGSRAGSGWIRIADEFGVTRAEIAIDRAGLASLTLMREDASHAVQLLAADEQGRVTLFDDQARPTTLGPGTPSRGPAAEPFPIDDPRPPRQVEPRPGSDDPIDIEPADPDQPVAPTRPDATDLMLGNTFRLDMSNFRAAYTAWVRDDPDRRTMDDYEQDLENFASMFEERSLELTVRPDGTWTARTLDRGQLDSSAEGDWIRIGSELELRVLTQDGRPEPDEPPVRLRPLGERTVLLITPEDEFLPYLPLTRN